MQGFVGNFVWDVGAVKIRSINMVPAGRDRFAKDGHSGVRIFGRPEHARTGQLHCAISQPMNSEERAGKSEIAAEFSFIFYATGFHIIPYLITVYKYCRM